MEGVFKSLERRDCEIREKATANAEDAKDAKGRGGRQATTNASFGKLRTRDVFAMPVTCRAIVRWRLLSKRVCMF
jgi:hypothetical protein